MTESGSGPVDISVDRVTAPDGSTRVRLQLPDGYVLLWPWDARTVAVLLLQVAEETDGPW
jgi:hypothetical protein